MPQSCIPDDHPDVVRLAHKPRGELVEQARVRVRVRVTVRIKVKVKVTVKVAVKVKVKVKD